MVKQKASRFVSNNYSVTEMISVDTLLCCIVHGALDYIPVETCLTPSAGMTRGHELKIYIYFPLPLSNVPCLIKYTDVKNLFLSMHGFQLILCVDCSWQDFVFFSYNIALFVLLTRINCFSLLSNFNSVQCHAFVKFESSTVVIYRENKRKTLPRMWSKRNGPL